MSDPVLSLSDIHVAYGGNSVLNVDRLDLQSGELVGVVGANGAGKSTLVNAAMGWSRGDPDMRATVRLASHDLSNAPTHKRVDRGLLLVPEGKLVFSTMTVEENLLNGWEGVAEGRRAYSTEDVLSLFPRLRERRNHLGGQLSGGERQMLGIGKALRLAPRALLLDEPSIGLAPKLVLTVLETVASLAKEGLCVLLVEQNVKAAIEVVDRLVLLERGRIVVSGPVEEMRDNPRIAEAYLGAHAA